MDTAVCGCRAVLMHVSHTLHMTLSMYLSAGPELPLAGFTRTPTTALETHGINTIIVSEATYPNCRQLVD